jgi:3-oxoacyl-[acyl-carrier protein] reductase
MDNRLHAPYPDNMDTQLKDKAALVCGASRGIGAATARALAAEGAAVILVARNEAALTRLAEELGGFGQRAAPLCFDLSRTEKLGELADRALSLYGRVDILVNNTGGPPAGRNLGFTAEDWRQAFENTFLSAEVLTRLLVPAMAERGWGRIVNLTSVSVRQPVEDLILSNSIRAAVIGWAKTLSREFASRGVTINNIATGYTLTDRISALAEAEARESGGSSREVIEAMAAAIPMKRLARPEEIAQAVVYLASGPASYVTGVTLPVDGGYIRGL